MPEVNTKISDAFPDSGVPQREAANPGYSVWVAASAGSGKTRVLTERVLRLLLKGVPPSHILCITYTKAAAAEMQNRLHARLAAWVAMPEKELVEALQDLTGEVPHARALERARQLFALLLEDSPGVRIQTIHAFCNALLARFPFEAGVPPHFTLLDEPMASELLRDAAHGLLTDAHGPHLTQALTLLAGELDEQRFGKLLDALIKKRRSLEPVWLTPGGPDAAIRRIYTALGVKPEDSEEALWQAHFTPDERRLRLLRAAKILVGLEKVTDRNLGEAIRESIAVPPEGMQVFDAYCSAYLAGEGHVRKRLFTKDVIAFYPEAAELLQEEANRVMALREQVRAIRTAAISAAMLRLAGALFERYAALRRRKGMLDYDDLILHATRLLHSSVSMDWVLYKLDGGIDHVLIDEAQDNSHEQWELTSALCAEFFAGQGRRESQPSLFAVGDEKQSIYRFQGAAPEAFDRFRRKFAAAAEEAGHPFREIGLDVSFRSTPAVLALVDAVFSGPARDGLGEREGPVRHYPFRANRPGRVELWPLISVEKKEKHETWLLPDMPRRRKSADALLAQTIAATLAKWFAEGRELPARQRPVRPGDVMILVRTRSKLVGHLLRRLREHGVPVAGLDRMKLTEHIAVQDLLALVAFLLLPEDDLSLAALLKSPLYGLDDDDLFVLCNDRGEASLRERLNARASSCPRCAAAAQELKALLGAADYLSPYAIFAELLYRRDGRRRFLARLGEDAAEALALFLDEARRYEESHTPSLQGFLQWFGEGEAMIKRDMEQAGGKVRIMTVHGAKGLEAPVVFLPDTATLPKKGRLDDNILSLDGEGAPAALFSPRKEEMPALLLALLEQEDAARTREYHRQLYVAMTRAEDELYICGYQGEINIPKTCWYRLVEEGMRTLPGCEEVQAEGLTEGVLWRYINPGEGEKEEERQKSDTPLSPLPDYFLHPVAAVAPAPQDEPEIPPLPGDTSRIRQVRRGEMIHRLLQLLPALPAGEREAAAMRYLALHTSRHFSETMRGDMVAEAMKILNHPDFSSLFGPGSRAEVPLAAKSGNSTLLRRIDRLVITDDEVHIIDFKTDSLPPDGEPPAAYVRQMAMYRQLVAGLYPNRRIRASLLYTAGPMLYEMPF